MIDYNKVVNENQLNIIMNENDLLVKACPGSGKTRTLIYKMAYYLEKNPYNQRKLVAITYTNRAADEMKNRLDALDIPIERLWAGTIHQFCLEWILRRFKMYDKSLSKGFNIIDERIKEIYLNKTLQELHSQYKSYDINTRYDRKLKLEETNKDIVDIIKVYHELLVSKKELDFDLILGASYRLLKKNNFICQYIKNAIELICIDEFQDTQDLQYAIIEEIMNAESSHKPQIMFVGDTNQAIYGSLGGIAKELDILNREFSKHQFIELELNGCYRSSQRIIDYYMSFMVDDYIIKSSSSLIDYKGVLTFSETIHQNDLYEKIANIILENLKKGIPENEICVVAPVWYFLFPFSNKLKTLLPDVSFDAPDITPIKRDPLNVFYNISRLLLTNPDIKQYNYRRRISREIINRFEEDFNLQLEDINELDLLNLILNSKSDDKRGSLFIINSISNFLDSLKINIEKSDLLEKEYTEFTNKMNDRLNNISYELSDDIDIFKKMFKEREGVVISSCHGIKGEEYETVIAFGLLRGRLPNWSECGTDNEVENSKKMLYVIASRAKKNLYLIAERGRTYGRNKTEYETTRELKWVKFDYDNMG